MEPVYEYRQQFWLQRGGYRGRHEILRLVVRGFDLAGQVVGDLDLTVRLSRRLGATHAAGGDVGRTLPTVLLGSRGELRACPLCHGFMRVRT